MGGVRDTAENLSLGADEAQFIEVSRRRPIA